MTEKVLYRYQYEKILIDFIPFESTDLGATNRWLKPGFEFKKLVELDQFKIKILPVHWFLATKWEAFKNRGNDPRTSPDFEDIIYVIDNNSNMISDFEYTHKSVKNFLQNMCLEIINHPSKDEIIECHINPYTVVERKKIILDKLNFMAFYQ